ncbi:MAG TPA: hypothetical protein PKM25_07545 [Candidatus Ozemobacteraceae bacterium]|nr:hypothetical protein [Candidatus Ozemobacteraceae bacterium]
MSADTPGGFDGREGELSRFQAWVNLLASTGQASVQNLEAAFLPHRGQEPPSMEPIRRFGRMLPLPLLLPDWPGGRPGDLAYYILGKIEMDLERAGKGDVARVSMLPTDLREVARDIRSIFGENAVPDQLLAIADRKEEILSGRQRPPVEALKHLPELAFPVILGAGGQPVVVWETVFTRSLARVHPPIDHGSDSNFAEGIERASALIRKQFGDSIDTELLCPATHLFGLKTQGFSGSLAMWAALWLAVMGVRVPGGALAVTGKLTDSGQVVGVADTEMKVKIALSCGFPHVVVPSEDLESGPAWMRQDGRIIGVRNCEQFREWLLLADPEYSTRGKLFHVARGVVSRSSLPSGEPIRQLIAADLEAGTWTDTWRNLRRITRESPRSGRSKRWQAVIVECRDALSDLLRENREGKIPRERWFGLFRAVVPESVFLLHVPLILERYGRHERALADRLYARLGHRLADQDLNLDLALKWGKTLFTSPELSPWARNREFRDRYPLLCWLLFSDPFTALETMAGWKPLSSLEKRWWRRIFQGLKRLAPAELADPENKSQRRLRRMLAFAARAGSPAGEEGQSGNSLGGWEFRPTLANVTPIDRRPERMLRILQTSEQLTGTEIQTLNRHFRAHIESRHPTDEDRRLVEDLLPSRKAGTVERRLLAQRCRGSTLQMLRECAGILGGKSRESGSGNWIELLQDAWRGRAGSDADAAEESRRKRIRCLDDVLTRALGNLYEGTIGEECELAFQCLANPTLALARLVLAFEVPAREQWQAEAHLDRWYSLVVRKPLPGLGFRSDLVRECLLHWAGRLTGEGRLPEPRRIWHKSLGLSFWSGFHTAGGRSEKPVSGDTWREWIVSAVLNGNPSMIWLPVAGSALPRGEWNLLEADLLRHYEGLMEQAGDGNGEKKLLGLMMCHAAWPKRKFWKSFPGNWLRAAELREKAFCNEPNRCLITEEGLVPMGIAWQRRRFPRAIGLRLAGSRGFTPVAPACRELFYPRGNRPMEKVLRLLESNRLWQVEWERNLFLTMFLFQCRDAGRWNMVSKAISSDSCDLPNTFLGCELLAQKRGTRAL